MGHCWNHRSEEEIVELRNDFYFVWSHSRSSFSTICRLFADRYGYASPNTVEKIVTHQSYKEFGGTKSSRGLVTQNGKHLLGSTALTLAGNNHESDQKLMRVVALKWRLKIDNNEHEWFHRQACEALKRATLNEEDLIRLTEELGIRY